MFIKFNNSLINILAIMSIDINKNDVILIYSKLHCPKKKDDECYMTIEEYETEKEAQSRLKELELILIKKM